MKWWTVGIALVLMTRVPMHAQKTETDALQDAQRQYAGGKWADAETSLRNVTREHPDNIAAQMYLGHTLFREEKYAAAIAPYEHVQSLERSGVKLTLEQHRILVDQLAMAYGISGRTSDSKALLQAAVRNDPGYPLNYYNLACVAADENDKPAVLRNLALAYGRRAQFSIGEQMPDPAADSSFQKYGHDADFKALVARFKTTH